MNRAVLFWRPPCCMQIKEPIIFALVLFIGQRRMVKINMTSTQSTDEIGMSALEELKVEIPGAFHISIGIGMSVD